MKYFDLKKRRTNTNNIKDIKYNDVDDAYDSWYDDESEELEDEPKVKKFKESRAR